MKVYKQDFEQISSPVVATIGFFDGVHKGHQYLIEQVIEEAKKRSLPSAVITFAMHPREVLDSGYKPDLLTSHEEKLQLLEKTGIDICIVMDFTKEFARLSAHDFMRDVLKKELNVDTLVIGYDHRFGHERKDGFAEYVEYGKKLGISVYQAKELNTGVYVSSSTIRKLLREGNVEGAAELLGYNYIVSGKIIEGHKVGRTIGFPTANIDIRQQYKVTPACGVYATYVYMDGQRYEGMLYVGRRPTFHMEEELSVEVNIFDLDADLYGKYIRLEFLKFMRRDVKFENVEILRRQLQEDEKRVRNFLQEKVL